MATGNPTVVTGSRTNYNTTSAGIKVRDVEKSITLLKPYRTPIDDFFVSKLMKEAETSGEYSKFEWNEDKFLPDVVALTANISGGGTTETLNIANNYFLKYDTILVDETGDVLMATADSASGQVAVKKVGAGNITATTISTGNLMRLVPAFPEDGVKQNSLTTLTVPKYGYCQIMKKAVYMSGREQATLSYGDTWAYRKIKASLEIREAQERNWLLAGTAYNDGTNTTYTAGLRGTLTTNYIEYNGSLDEVEFDEAITQIAQNGTEQNSDVLVCMPGSLALMDMNKFMKSRYSIQQDSKELLIKQYGIANATKMQRPHFIDYLHPMITLRVVHQPMLKGNKWGTAVPIFDPANVIKRYMRADEDGTRKYRVEENIKTPGQDRKEMQFLFDQGLQIKLEETGGWLQKKGA